MNILENKSISKRQLNGFFAAFTLIALCFALWGFANNVTSPMVGAFSKIFRMSTSEATLVPVVFNLGYFCMALPAALFIQRFSFKWGVLVGLALYALGAFLFLPAKMVGSFMPFLGAYFVLTCGLSFLETSCNPYVYCMGSEKRAVQRLNTAQAINALGSVAGMLVAVFVHQRLNPLESHVRAQMPQQQFDIIKDHDLNILIEPYIYIGAMVVLIMVVLYLTRVPRYDMPGNGKDITTILTELWHRKNYREGVLAEFFYVGAQAACWMYIIVYGTRIFIAEGMTEQEAQVLSQKFNIVAIVFFACSRFICAWLMNWFSPERMLSTMAILGIAALMGVIFLTDRNGIYCLVTVSICLSLMFPTIYGLALRGIGENIKIAGAGLIMAILGGSFFPPIQATIIESHITVLGLPSTNLSFLIPMLCLAMIVWYAHRAYVRHCIRGIEE